MPVWRMYPGGGRRHPSQGIERSFFSLISTAEQAGRSIRKTRRMRAHFRIGLTSRKKAKEMLDPTFWTGPAIASLRYHTNPSGSRPLLLSSFQLPDLSLAQEIKPIKLHAGYLFAKRSQAGRGKTSMQGEQGSRQARGCISRK